MGKDNEQDAWQSKNKRRRLHSKSFSRWGIELPYPPSINHAYHNVHGRRCLKPDVATYKTNVSLLVANARQHFGDVPMPFQMFVYVYPPDKRKRDLDNILKVMQDAICDGLSVDDSQIVVICAIRCQIVSGGMVEIIFTECNADEWIEEHGGCQTDRLMKFVSLPQDR